MRFGYRDYDPDTGRFTALDPLGYAAGDSDLYGYCLDDPVNLVDPEGLQGINAQPDWDDPTVAYEYQGVYHNKYGMPVGEKGLERPLIDPIDFVAGGVTSLGTVVGRKAIQSVARGIGKAAGAAAQEIGAASIATGKAAGKAGSAAVRNTGKAISAARNWTSANVDKVAAAGDIAADLASPMNPTTGPGLVKNIYQRLSEMKDE